MRLPMLCRCMALAGALSGTAVVGSGQEMPREEVLVRATNPDPKTLPTLYVFQRPRNYPKDMRRMTLVASTFPNVPNFNCDSWCYEIPVEFTKAKAIDGGRI